MILVFDEVNILDGYIMTGRLKTRLIILAVIAVMLIGAKGSPLIRLTIRNKSGQQIAVRLTKDDLSRFYYLHVPAGDSYNPNDVTFTVVKDIYRMRIFYFLESDPETGYECILTRNAVLLARRNIRVTVTQCFGYPPTRGEPTQVKMGRWHCIR